VIDLNGKTKTVAFTSLLLASAFFLSIIVLENQQSKERLVKFTDDAWVNQKIAETFPDFPVITRLDKVTNTTKELQNGVTPNWAEIVVDTLGWQPDYYRLFMVYQRNPVDGDLSNHYHFGFITSDLMVHDIGQDVVYD
jgi:hypothetical protein